MYIISSENKLANSLMRDKKGEAKKIILPFQRFQGLKFHPMNKNPFLYLSDVFSVWLKNINTALSDRIKVSLTGHIIHGRTHEVTLYKYSL